MRRFNKVFVFVFFIAMAGAMTAQNAQSVAEQQYINSFSGVDSNGKLI